jgi:aerobic C4-dicarboxylate transport protein
MKAAFAGAITNEDSAIMLGEDEEYERENAKRLAAGQPPLPKFAGGPDEDAYPEIRMSDPATGTRAAELDDQRG